MQAFYEDGTLRTVEPYKDGLRDGETILYRYCGTVIVSSAVRAVRAVAKENRSFFIGYPFVF